MVLIDFLLPDGDGSTILPLVRKSQSRSTEVVVISGSLQEHSMMRCLELGADAYQIKPVRRYDIKPLSQHGRPSSCT